LVFEENFWATFREQLTEEARLQMGKEIREAKKEARLGALFGDDGSGGWVEGEGDGSSGGDDEDGEDDLVGEDGGALGRVT
jgi:hypothetical protein